MSRPKKINKKDGLIVKYFKNWNLNILEKKQLKKWKILK